MNPRRLIPLSCRACLAGVLIMVLAGAVQADRTLSGQVTRVLGPDRIEVRGPGEVLYQVHLRGTTAPEAGDPAAFQAETHLISELVGRHVTLTRVTGSGTRLDAVVEYGRADLNQEMIRDGLLEFDDQTTDPDLIYDYTTAEDRARLEALGVWRPMEERETMPAPVIPAHPLAVPEGGWQFRPSDPDS